MRAHSAVAVVVALAAGLVVPGVPASAEPQGEAKRRVEIAAGELESSIAAVQDAARQLAAVASQLPAARSNVAAAQGELAGARAVLAGATRNVRRAELATMAAGRKVEEATARVTRGRQTIGELARRSYQQGPLGDLRQMFLSGSPQDLVDRAATLRMVFRGQNEVLHDLSVDRLRLATVTAQRAAQQQQLEDARDLARAGEKRARAVTVQAEQAAARVADLLGQRTKALTAAEAARAEDEAEYRAANEASRRLAERLRAQARARALAAARARTSVPRVSSSRFQWPTNGQLTSRYGYRQHPIYGDTRFHAGIDIGAGWGTSVWAAAAGTVVHAGSAGGYGNLVLVSHGTYGGRDIVTGYAHMSSISVVVGEQIQPGEQVGRVGSTGNSTGPHLHFEVRRDGDPVEPLEWVSPP